MRLVDVCNVIAGALAFLPARYDSQDARAMLVAIGLQESGFAHRHQIGGPARGYWQFEEIGVRGVLDHPSTSSLARMVLRRCDYDDTTSAAYGAIAHNDVVATCFARLLLWRLPHALPWRHDPQEGWRQYLISWRPGKPHPDNWADNYQRAWGHVA